MKLPSVLLIDDEQEFVSALSERFALRGMPVECALNGAEGLARLGEHPFDIVLLDMRMPGMSCRDILQQIQRISPGTRVIILTGYGALQDGSMDEYTNAYTVLEKPVKINDLIARIQQTVTEL